MREPAVVLFEKKQHPPWSLPAVHPMEDAARFTEPTQLLMINLTRRTYSSGVAKALGRSGRTLPRLISLGRVRPDRPEALATPLEYVLRVKLIIQIFVGFVNRAASSMGWAAGPLHGGCCSPSNNTTAGSRTCSSCGCPWASVRKKLFSHGSRARP